MDMNKVVAFRANSLRYPRIVEWYLHRSRHKFPRKVQDIRAIEVLFAQRAVLDDFVAIPHDREVDIDEFRNGLAKATRCVGGTVDQP